MELTDSRMLLPLSLHLPRLPNAMYFLKTMQGFMRTQWTFVVNAYSQFYNLLGNLLCLDEVTMKENGEMR